MKKPRFHIAHLSNKAIILIKSAVQYQIQNILTIKKMRACSNSKKNSFDFYTHIMDVTKLMTFCCFHPHLLICDPLFVSVLHSCHPCLNILLGRSILFRKHVLYFFNRNTHFILLNCIHGSFRDLHLFPDM